MHTATVKLTTQAQLRLKQAARSLKVEPDQAFECVIRNALQAYYAFDLGGHALLIDKIGNCQKLACHKLDEEQPLTLTQKFTKVWSAKHPKKVSTPAYRTFTFPLDEEVTEDIKMQAGLFGFTTVDFINQLVNMGSILVMHFSDGGQAWAYNKTGAALGQLAFTKEGLDS